MTGLNRRTFLRQSAALAALASTRALTGAEKAPGAHTPDAITPGTLLEPWQPGMLDIHHINTGRGNASLILCPDGTSILIDAGAANTPVQFMNPARPNDSRRPGEWIARYAQRQLSAAHREELDYVVVTHLHVDHMGGVGPLSTISAQGGYRLTGISDVAEQIKIGRLIDRGFPAYDYPAKQNDPSVSNYASFTHALSARGTPVERLSPGRANQIRLLHEPEKYASFAVRNLAVNGEVWTGGEEATQSYFPSLTEIAAKQMTAEQMPSENMCSIALRLNYGRFSYYTGSDLTCDTNYGRDAWRDIETPVARVAGPVSVATVNHHGYFDAAGPDFVRLLRPRVWILQSWHASHPSMPVLANLYSTQLYEGNRDVFCTGLKNEAWMTTARFSDRFRNRDGHVLVRVAPGGDEYNILVLDASDESSRVQASFGPYPS
jgi:beta-lactamase superfamily II metal-dependent hydrolase